MVLTCYAIAMVLVWAGVSIYLVSSYRRINFLKEIAVPPNAGTPSVALIIAVRNEEAEVEEALRSVCGLAYSNFTITVINDRSTDRTPDILKGMAQANPQIRLITVDGLPPGWLGKNHALYHGYLASREEWLLFTDADVKFAPDALRKAMHYVAEEQLDHLTIFPEIASRSWLFQCVVNTFALMLNMKLRPWNVSDPSSSASVGVGAFNLVRRTVYEKAGTHAAISLRPDDDLKLGERVKKAGFRQGVLYGEKEIWLQWYTSLGAFIQGLMKNTFSVSNYNLYLSALFAFATFILIVLPVPFLLLAGFPYWLMGTFILLTQVLIMLFARGIKARWWHALLIPFAGLVMVYIIVRSSLLTIRQGGIYWRDSFYSLKELKKQA